MPKIVVDTTQVRAKLVVVVVISVASRATSRGNALYCSEQLLQSPVPRVLVRHPVVPLAVAHASVRLVRKEFSIGDREGVPLLRLGFMP